MSEVRYQDMLAAMTPDIHQRLRKALELSKWPDGSALSTEQKTSCMEAVIAYEIANLPEEQRVGYIDRGKKAADALCDDPQPLILPDS
jgi:uncharacterized protein YeaC (DUF1315 family)